MRMRSFRARHFDNKTDNETDHKHLLMAGLLRGPLDDNPKLRENCYSFMKDIHATQAY